jgi:tryptophan aminotransferase
MARCTTLRTVGGSEWFIFASDSHYSRSALSSPVRGLLSLESIPGMISLRAGRPNPVTFPIEGLSISLRSPTAHQPYSSAGGDPVCETVKLEGKDIAVALQYTSTDGLPELRKLLGEFQLKEHSVVVDDAEAQLAMGSGSQDLLYKAFTSVLDRGDSVLIEAPAYA